MNDADWIRLLGEQSLRELSDEEVAALRVRIQQSAAVRQAAQDSLQLEETLSAGLANVNLSVEDLLQRVLERGRRQRQPQRPAWWKWVGLAAGVFILAAGAFWWSRPQSASIEPPESVVSSDDDPASTPSIHEGGPRETPRRFDAAAENPDVVSAILPQNRNVEAPAPVAPWTEWLAPNAVPLPASSPRLVGDLKAIGHDELPLAEFRRWWDDVPNQRAGVNQDIIGQRRTVHLQGWARLKAPWVADTQLRLTPFDVREIALYVWAGDTGVALRFYRNREPHLWTAYEIHRKPGETTPDRWGLLTTDNGTFYHSGAATLELAIESGRLILSTGQMPILTVPCEKLPTDVLLAAESRLRGFSWLRTAPRELTVAAQEPSLFADDPPANWSWRLDQATEAMLQRDPDGGVTLTGSSRKEITRVYVPLDRPGLFETIVQLAAADPGTGVYLGDEAGKPLGQLAFFKDRRNAQTTFGFLRPNDRRLDTDFDDRAQPPPYFVPHSRQRIVAGLGIWNTWCSGDGEHWGHVIENPVRDVNGAVRSVGLYCLPGETPRTIRLERAEVRPLSGVSALADAGLMDSATKVMEARPRTFEEWLQRAWDHKPLGANPGEWCDTCAVAALHSGLPRDLSNQLVDRLAVSAVDRGHTATEQRRLFDECLLLTDQWHDPESRRWSRRYADLGRETGNDPDGLTAWTTFLESPRWSHQIDRNPFQERIRGDLVTAAYRSDWATVRATARRVLFDVAPAHPDHQPRDAAEALDRFARWSRGSAVDQRAGGTEDSEEALPVGWRNPVQWPVNKEAYNISAELQAALSTGSYRDAGRIVTSITDAESLGLLPDRRDPNLLISLPLALEAAMVEVPEFAAALREEFGELGRLRVKQAVERADVAALQAAMVQFPGTPAAAEAELWLGDRQLAIGEFLAAGLHYRRALRCASEEQRSDITARLQLIERLLGPLPGEPVSLAEASSQLGGINIASLAPTRPVVTPAPATPRELLPTPLPIAPYKLDRRGRFDGQTGQNAGRNEYRDSDPFGRQFGVAVDAQRMYLSNRFQVTAYHRTTGDRQWSAAVGGDQGEAHAHRFTAMPPLVVGDRLYVRRMTKVAIELVCLDATNGNVVWTHQPGPNAAVLSDPVWIAGRLYAITAGELEQDLWDLQWTEFDLLTGRPKSSASVLRLRNAWDKEIPCQIAVKGPQVILAAGGATVAFDLQGAVEWLRRDLWLPPRIDPRQFDHYVLPPVFTESMVLTAQPNVRTVQALDRRTGRRLWSRPLPELMGVVAVHRNLAIAAEPDRLTALDVRTGGVLWQAEVDRWLGPIALDDERLCVVRRETRVDRRGWLMLTWLDRNTGRALADLPIEAEEKDDWRVGPWFTVDKTMWTLSEAGAGSPHRDLSVLRALSDQSESPGPQRDVRLGPWTAQPSTEDAHATQVVLPGWQPLISNRETLEFVPGDIHGERTVLRTKVAKDRKLSFGRLVSLRDDAMPVLQLRVGRDGDTGWTLVVRVDDQVVHEQVIDAQTAPTGWCDVHLPLGAFNGQTFLLQVQQHPIGDRPATALWKAAELVAE